ncbi:MAG: hypothetical protein KKE05_00270 [Nanoarchaeota archaeon]|nr:hypothetical protein [Nanoarchaeota archaeon]
MQDYTIEYKKIAAEEARLLKHLAECAAKRAELLKMEIEVQQAEEQSITS